MEKISFVILIIFICVFSYLPKSISTICFVLFVFSSFLYVLCKRKKINKIISLNAETIGLKKLYTIFLFVSSIFFILSFTNIPKFWDIKYLAYDVSYIPRHFVIIAELFMPIMFSFAIYRKHIIFNTKVSVLIFLYILIILVCPGLCVKGLLLIILSLISWKLNSKLIMLMAFFIFYEQLAYVIGFIALMLLLVFEKKITAFLNVHTYKKVTFLLIISIICIFLLSETVMYFVTNDSNSLWRLNVWINEYGVLSQTYYTGVGFGSAYVTDDIIYRVENTGMYYNNSEESLYTGVFLIANHSSVINMFYRMGIIGGLLFLALNVQLIRVVVKLYHNAEKGLKSLLWRLFSVFIYETIIIALNPGLEMMQFALSYLLSCSFMLAVIWEIQSKQYRFALPYM